MCIHGHWCNMNIMRHWPLNRQWPRCSQLGSLHALIQALCTVQMSGKGSFLWITGRLRMYASPVRRKPHFHTQQQAVWKPRVRPFRSCELFDETMVPTKRGGTLSVLGGTRTPRWFHFFSPTQLGWSCAGNFVVVIKSRERDKSTGSDSRCPRQLHTRQLSRQPKVKPPVRGSPELLRVSFTKQDTTGTVYTNDSHSGII